MLSLIIVTALLAGAVYKGYLFIDFQIQVGKFTWGRRLGVKRRPVATLPVTKAELAVLKVLSDAEKSDVQ